MKARVRLKIEGGVINVFHVPEGVEVEIIDYDVEGESPDEMDRYQGELCRHWVERSNGYGHCEYDNDEGWERWNRSMD